MKYLKKFNTEADKTDWLTGSKFVAPNVVLTDSVVEYNLESPAMYPLHIEAIEDLTISFSNNYEYSKDNSTWSSGTSSTTISVNAGEKVYFRTIDLTTSSVTRFSISNGTCNVAGNVMSMAYGADFWEKTSLADYQLKELFYNVKKIKDASRLVLPATTLTGSCYRKMFYGCTSLVTAPKLPATTLAKYCYESMFEGCTSLVSAPELPATTLEEACYKYMFAGCTSLVNAPKLPATTLAKYCYKLMFDGCTSLVSAPELPATTLTGSECYQFMFRDCTSLNYIKAMFTTYPQTAYTGNWVSGVSPTGTFVKNSAATWNVTGVDGIPSGWTVETADA